MRLRRGRTLDEMVPPKKTSLPQNNPPDAKPSVTSMVGITVTSNPVGMIGPNPKPNNDLDVITSSGSFVTPVKNITTTPMATQEVVGDPRHPLCPKFYPTSSHERLPIWHAHCHDARFAKTHFDISR